MREELAEKELDIYSRQIALSDIDYQGQLKLRNSEVAIVGLGGLGSHIAQKCAGMGVGRIRLIDRDIVSRSDLHRQYLYDVDSLGLPKVEIAKRRLKSINPDVELIPIPESINPSNTERLIKGVDLVLDGLDGPEARYLVNRACVKLKIPFIFGAAIETYGNIAPIIPGETFCLECFMPGLRDEDLPKCAVVGVHPSALGIITSIQVYEAIRILTGKEPVLKNRLLYVELKELRFQSLRIEKSESCAVCGGKSDKKPAQIRERLIEETCSRDGKRNFVVSPRRYVDIDIKSVKESIVHKKYKIINEGSTGVSFELPNGISISMLKSGIIIAQADPHTEGEILKHILDEYRFIIRSLGLPEDVIPDEKDSN